MRSVWVWGGVGAALLAGCAFKTVDADTRIDAEREGLHRHAELLFVDGALAGTVTEVESEGKETELVIDALTEVGAGFITDALAFGKRRSGTLQAASYGNAAPVARAFTDALITEVKVPDSDGSNKDGAVAPGKSHPRIVLRLDTRLASNQKAVDAANAIVPARGAGLPTLKLGCESPCNAVDVHGAIIRPGSITARVGFIDRSVPWQTGSGPGRGRDAGPPEFVAAEPKGMSFELGFDMFEDQPRGRGGNLQIVGPEHVRGVRPSDGGFDVIIDARVYGKFTIDVSPNPKPQQTGQ